MRTDLYFGIASTIAIAMVVAVTFRIARRDRGRYTFLLARAWAAQHAGHPRRSRAITRIIGRTCPRRAIPAVAMCEANALLWDGQFTRALALLDEKVLPVGEPALGVAPVIIKLEALLFAGRIDEATQLFDEHRTALRAATDGAADVIAIEGFIAFHRGDLTGAKELLGRAVSRTFRWDPLLSGAHYFLAAIAHRVGEHEEAQRLLTRTIREGGRRFTTLWAEQEHAEHFPDLALPRRAVRPARRSLWLSRDLRLGIGALFLRVSPIAARSFTPSRLVGLIVLDVLVALAVHGVELERGGRLVATGSLVVVAPLHHQILAADNALARAGDRGERLAVLGTFYAALPFFLVGWFGAVQLGRPVFGDVRVAELVVGGWSLVSFFVLCRKVRARAHPGRWILCGAALAVAWLVPMHVAARTRVFFTPVLWNEAEAEAQSSKELADNQQRNELAFMQLDRFAEAKSALVPERAGVPELFFIGGAGWADQDVFLREARSARALFDEKFGTAGHSLLLANDSASREYPALVNATLRHAVKAVADKMNRDEDVLFLFVTSHGSDEGLALDFGTRGGFRDEVLRPTELRRMLDDAGIRWRVLVVSGCESGVFIAPLRDEQTLIVTASAADRASYGCADGRAYTDFGRALFDEELPRNAAFDTAFANVVTTIAKREADEDLVASRPQVAEGSRIAAKLRELESHLRARTSSAVPSAVRGR